MKREQASLCALFMLGCLTACATHLSATGVKQKQQQPIAIRVAGDVEKPQTWTNEQLKQTFADDLHPIEYSVKGDTARSQCVSLLRVAQYAVPRLNAKIKNHALAFTVLLRSDDGYTIAFSMGELLADFGGKEVWLALDRDGKPLSEEEGPARVLVPSETKKFARWLHGLKSITLVDGARVLDTAEHHDAP